jgi:hypothetical protein
MSLTEDEEELRPFEQSSSSPLQKPKHEACNIPEVLQRMMIFVSTKKAKRTIPSLIEVPCMLFFEMPLPRLS